MDIKLNQNEYQETLKNNNIVLLDFYADWCGPCQTLLPTIQKLAEEYEGKVAIKKVNVDENSELAAQFQVRSIPTLIYFSEGKVAGRLTGLTSESDLKNQLNKLISNSKN
jgi:thioredoxin 1